MSLIQAIGLLSNPPYKNLLFAPSMNLLAKLSHISYQQELKNDISWELVDHTPWGLDHRFGQSVRLDCILLSPKSCKPL